MANIIIRDLHQGEVVDLIRWLEDGAQLYAEEIEDGEIV